VETERPEGEAAVYFRIAPRLTIIGVFLPFLLGGHVVKFL